MKGISKIKIKHYKGLYGTYTIDLSESCKNLLLYGENGSGKSSICDAIKLMFEASSDKTKTFKKEEHKFLEGAELDTGYIQLTFIKSDGLTDKPEILSCDNKQRPIRIPPTNHIYASLIRVPILAKKNESYKKNF